MLNKELKLTLGDTTYEIFLQTGFFGNIHHIRSVLHKHAYSEVHVILSGEVDMLINNSVHSFCTGDVFVVPEECFHTVKNSAPNTHHVAFQLKNQFGYQRISLGDAESKGLAQAISNYLSTGNALLIEAYLTVICAQLTHNQHSLALNDIEDRTFLIAEFFAKNYNRKIALEDLAKRLNVSVKQAERLVVKHTGSAFSKELSNQRIEVAKWLLKETSLTMKDIANQVGYSSYSSLWKALNKQNQSPDAQVSEE